jgi:uncharacterized protein YceH (UPF0502 family)
MSVNFQKLLILVIAVAALTLAAAQSTSLLQPKQDAGDTLDARVEALEEKVVSLERKIKTLEKKLEPRLELLK